MQTDLLKLNRLFFKSIGLGGWGGVRMSDSIYPAESFHSNLDEKASSSTSLFLKSGKTSGKEC